MWHAVQVHAKDAAETAAAAAAAAAAAVAFSTPIARRTI
jgi:H+/Cl- antiporter ClcA